MQSPFRLLLIAATVASAATTTAFSQTPASPMPVEKNMARTDLPSGQMPMSHSSSNSHLTSSGKIRTSSYLGDNGREMYASLSDKARDKFKDIVRSRFEQKPDMTEEQRSAYAQKVFKSIKEADSKASASASRDKGSEKRGR